MKKFFSLLIFAFVALATFAQHDTLRISVLGDSYSTYEGYLTPDTNYIWYFRPENPNLHEKNDVRQVEQTWWHQVVSRLGAKLELNNSFSGSTVCYTGYKDNKVTHSDYSDRAFITRSNRLGNPNIILICGGTNDSWAGAPVGDYVYGNWTREQLFSYRPALAKLFCDMKANYPTSLIVFMLNSGLRDDINESTHTICKHYAIPCLDLHDIDKQHGHPSIKGMTSIADQVIDYIKTLAK